MDPSPTPVPFLLVLSNPSLVTKDRVDNRLLQEQAVAENRDKNIRQINLTKIEKYSHILEQQQYIRYEMSYNE